jgi:ABC-type polysaccharide transport system, permease component
MNEGVKGTRKESFRIRVQKDFKKNWQLYVLIIPILIYFFVFCYLPMVGVIIAFQSYSPALGIFKSSFIGFKNFSDFFGSYYIGRLIKNTLLTSTSVLIFSFPCPIILALLLNEVHNKKYKKAIQTISYLPFFISLVVICGLIKSFTGPDGMITQLIMQLGGKQQDLLSNPNMFRPIYVISDIWQNVGFSSIIYLAALSGVNQELYEAAAIDGAGRWKQTLNVTLPGIAPTIIIMLILALGGLFNVGYEKIILLSNPMNMETADVIQSFVYRKGLIDANYGYSTAVGLFNSVINTLLLIVANKISRKVTETSLF